MWEKHLGRRALLIGAVLLIALYYLWPPWDLAQNLKGGLDIAGGVSMIFEIDETGLAEWEKAQVAEQMKTLLQRRVDPDGVFNLTWRVLGRNRLEVQMPLPPEGVKQLRDRYNAAIDRLSESILTRRTLDAALRADPVQRPAELLKLAAGSARRQAALTVAATAYDEYRAALDAYRAAAATQPASATTEPSEIPPHVAELELAQRNAAEALEDAINAVLAENVSIQHLQSVLDMDRQAPARDAELSKLKSAHPELTAQLEEVIQAYAAWGERRHFLEGPADLQRLLKGAGTLDFRILAEPDPQNPTRYDKLREQLQERGPKPAPKDTEGWFKIENPVAFFMLKSPAELAGFNFRNYGLAVVEKLGDDFYVLAKLGERDGLLTRGRVKWQLKAARPSRDERGLPSVAFQLDAPGGAQFERLTSENINRQLCIVLDDVAYSSARIRSKIRESGEISGEFSPDKVRYLVQTLQAGALPARLKDTPLSERVIEARLGRANLDRAFRAGVVSLVIVCGIMAGYYMVGGLVANAALLLNIVLILAAMSFIQARFTLDGIAGVILTIGMAVDANVLIFERIREEKERGASLRMMLKNGYDKAFITIFDSNVTTLLTAVILYYLGGEDVKGFGITLGWGIVISLFTGLFVTRTVLTALVRYNLIRELKMLKWIRPPNIDWYGKRRVLWPISAVLILAGFASLFIRQPRELFDVEFMGGVSAVVEVSDASLSGQAIDEALSSVGRDIMTQADALASAIVADEPGQAAAYRVTVPGLAAPRIKAMITEPLEDSGLLRRDGVQETGPETLLVQLKNAVPAAELQERVRRLRSDVRLAGDNISKVNVNQVVEVDQPQQRGRLWNVLTTETNKRLVQHALVSALGEKLVIQPSVTFNFASPDGRPYPITEKRLEAVVPGLPPGAGGDVGDFYGGAAMHFTALSPPQTLGQLRNRLKNMRLQPGYQEFPWRAFDVFGITPAGTSRDGQPTYSDVVVTVSDPNFSFLDDPERWVSELAGRELELARAALESEQSLQKLTQFKPQIAAQAQTRAILAIAFSCVMIVLYVWIRFGTVIYGLGGVVALIHDVAVAVGMVALSGLIGGAGTPLGNFLLIEDFKINMPVIAALLTIIGFSINDTIVIFDRIRELRGRLGILTPELINRAINECMSRTILTSTTVFATLLSMYIFGGSGIRGFNFCMLVGVVSGVYSTIAIATPLLLVGKEFKVTTGAAKAPATARAMR